MTAFPLPFEQLEDIFNKTVTVIKQGLLFLVNVAASFESKYYKYFNVKLGGWPTVSVFSPMRPRSEHACFFLGNALLYCACK